MLDDFLGNIMSFIMTMLAFGVALFLFAFGVDMVKANYITDRTNKFVDECRVTGKVDPSRYQAYVSVLYDLGQYEITMEDERMTYWPNGSGKSYQDSLKISNDEILDVMYNTYSDKETSYKMKEGDRFTIEVRQTKKSLSERLFNIFVKTAGHDKLIVRYGGKVGD